MGNTTYFLLAIVAVIILVRVVKKFLLKRKLGGLNMSEVQIVDVRTTGEYNQAHAENTINIPLDRLAGSLKKLDKNKTIVVCCASGARSASARQTLIANGFNDVQNAGSWRNL